jgi:membrane associated rhomboid family serine protease
LAFSNRYPGSYSSGGFFPTGVKWLLIANVSVFILNFFAIRFGAGIVFRDLALVPGQVLFSFALWQLFTYMFLHDPFSFWHILFNMLTLWMFGADLERTWGTRRFLKYYFLCGVGAGVCVVLANAIFPGGSMASRTIGASGAIYGLLLAFGVLYPDRIVLFSFLFPIKAKYFVMILGGIAFLSSVGASDSNVSHIAHLGGMIFGYLYLKSGLKKTPFKMSFNVSGSVRQWYRNWKFERNKRKFQVYLRKQSDRDRYIH